MRQSDRANIVMNSLTYPQSERNAASAAVLHNGANKNPEVDKDLCHVLDWILQNAVRRMVKRQMLP